MMNDELTGLQDLLLIAYKRCPSLALDRKFTEASRLARAELARLRAIEAAAKEILTIKEWAEFENDKTAGALFRKLVAALNESESQ